MEAGAAGTIWAFDCAQRGQDSAIAVEGGLKLVFPATREGLLGAEVIHAYDLRADPGEERDLALDLGAEGDRIGDVAARLVRDALGLIESRAPISQADLDAADLELFQAMGYAGKGD